MKVNNRIYELGRRVSFRRRGVRVGAYIEQLAGDSAYASVVEGVRVSYKEDLCNNAIAAVATAGSVLIREQWDAIILQREGAVRLWL